MIRRAKVGFAASQVPTASTVTCARAPASTRRISVASAGSPAPWKVSATSGRVRGPWTISVAGPTGVGDGGPAATVGRGGGGPEPERCGGLRSGAAVVEAGDEQAATSSPEPAASRVRRETA